ncbi:MAG TPA: YciI family protein [Phycisphaerae bacterium]|nr:YciI family protein [Phycisphaerae bacterium]
MPNLDTIRPHIDALFRSDSRRVFATLVRLLGDLDRAEEATQNAFAAALDDLHAKGHFITASPLHPVATATSVRVREGKALISDGPFAETREQLGGFYMINADNLDEAIAIAARIPGAKKGTVEIRPVMEIPNIPHQQS